MVDDLAIVRAWLAADAGVAALCGTRVHAALRTPPEGWTPDSGSCLVFNRRGGTQDQAAITQIVSLQIKCYGGGATHHERVLAANEVYRTLFDAANDRCNGTVLWAQKEGQGQTLNEPDTGWPYVLCFYRAHVRNAA